MIIISGGGDTKKSFEIDKYFIHILKKRRILYIPLAMKRNTIGYEACYDWIVSTLSQHSDNFIEIDMCLNLLQIDGNIISEYDAIYLGGGNTYKLLDEIKQSHFDKIIEKFLSNGNTVYGGSAGAIILGKSIDIVDEEKDRDINSSGLDLLGGHSVRCHYQVSDDIRICNFVKKNHLPVIAIPEGAGLAISNKVAKIVGNVKIAIFNHDGQKKYYSQHDTINL